MFMIIKYGALFKIKTILYGKKKSLFQQSSLRKIINFNSKFASIFNVLGILHRKKQSARCYIGNNKLTKQAC